MGRIRYLHYLVFNNSLNLKSNNAYLSLFTTKNKTMLELLIVSWNIFLSKEHAVVMVWLRPATKAPRGRPSPRRGAEENGKKQAETGGSG